MKKILFCLIIAVSVFVTGSIYWIDKESFLCPIEYSRDICIRSDGRGDGFFGSRRNGKRLHQGIDLFASVGAPVRAARFGIVVSANRNRGMGNYVIIRHSGGIVTVYGHLSRVFVNRGQLVRQGQIIGAVGKTGNANYRDIQPHLHLEIRKGGVPQDPLLYLE